MEDTMEEPDYVGLSQAHLAGALKVLKRHLRSSGVTNFSTYQVGLDPATAEHPRTVVRLLSQDGGRSFHLAVPLSDETSQREAHDAGVRAAHQLLSQAAV